MRKVFIRASAANTFRLLFRYLPGFIEVHGIAMAIRPPPLQAVSVEADILDVIQFFAHGQVPTGICNIAFPGAITLKLKLPLA